jgi:hypothetical protein
MHVCVNFRPHNAGNIRVMRIEVDELPEPVTLANPDETNLPLLSTRSALNARYVPRGTPAGQSVDNTARGRSATLKSTGPDMDRWLENVFNQALNGTADGLDPITLSRRLKGGGDKQQQVILVKQLNCQKPQAATAALNAVCTDTFCIKSFGYLDIINLGLV